ncbi:MAG: MarR family transcriptional regulator [Lachnospiraceae bacterium]|nr:MarR family transcriptional regulator [Lachnospiraceae bacterium]
MSRTYDTLNDVLVRLFHDIMTLEEKAIRTGEFCEISNNDMHIIEAIGISEPRNMSAIAKTLLVTVGTLTIAVNNLVKKGYVNRTRSEKDRRVVLISLTEKGKRAYEHHRQFHEKMIKATIQNMNPQEEEVLAQALTNLIGFFEQYQP